MQNKFGVMQGRLVPKYLGRYQAHPIGYWQEEFFIAQNLGLDCIEFILDFNEAIFNPLLTDSCLVLPPEMTSIFFDVSVDLNSRST